MTKLGKQKHGLSNHSRGITKTTLTKTSGSLQKGSPLSKSTNLRKAPTSLKKTAKRDSTRLVGDREESQCMYVLEKASLKIEETANSGATNYDGDFLIKLSPTYIRSEVKFRNTEGFTISKDHWKTILKKSLKHGGVPALITVNKSKTQLITMELSDFADILQNMKKGNDP